MGIFKNKWTVAKTAKSFEDLVKSAFSTRGFLRPWIELPGAHICVQLACRSLFKSEGIDHALSTAFDKRTLLFGPLTGRDKSDMNKTAVVATADEDQQPTLLASYNREIVPKDRTRQ